MFLNDEGSMLDGLGKTAFHAFLEMLSNWAEYVAVFFAILCAAGICVSFVWALVRSIRVPADAGLEQAEREVVAFDLAHRSDPLL